MFSLYSRCRNRARVDVGLSVGISTTVGIPSNKLRVVIVLTKNVVKIISQSPDSSSLVRGRVVRRLVW